MNVPDAPGRAPTADNDRPLYPSSHAFIIALRRDVDLAAGHCVGRIEHMSSGHAASFDRFEDLIEFAQRAIAGRPAGTAAAGDAPTSDREGASSGWRQGTIPSQRREK